MTTFKDLVTVRAEARASVPPTTSFLPGQARSHSVGRSAPRIGVATFTHGPLTGTQRWTPVHSLGSAALRAGAAATPADKRVPAVRDLSAARRSPEADSALEAGSATVARLNAARAEAAAPSAAASS